MKKRFAIRLALTLIIAVGCQPSGSVPGEAGPPPVEEDPELLTRLVGEVTDAITAQDMAALRATVNADSFSPRALNPECTGGVCRPLILAVAGEAPLEMIQLLVEKGAEINQRGGGRSGDTPLILAAMQERDELVELLASKGADPNLANHFGASPFWGVCAMGHLDYAKLLLEHGADVDGAGRFPDPLGQSPDIVTEMTPLMIASLNGHRELVSLLLASGAEEDLQDSLGRTFRDYEDFHRKNPGPGG